MKMTVVAEKSRKPIREGLFTEDANGVRLIGGLCRECAEIVFPANPFCPRCCRETTEPVALSRRGVLYSFTVQRFKPPPPYCGPDPFVPYGVGLIELPGGVRITSVLKAEPDDLHVGMEMELVVEAFFEDEDGNEILGYKFRPVEKR